jgi:hypothetical protein
MELIRTGCPPTALRGTEQIQNQTRCRTRKGSSDVPAGFFSHGMAMRFWCIVYTTRVVRNVRVAGGLTLVHEI